MPLAGATISSGATLSAAGGTTKTFTTAGETIPNGRKIVDLSVTDARIRPSITCVNKPAVLNAQTGTYSKGKRTLKLVKPLILANGEVKFPLVEIRVEDHPEMSQAAVDAMVYEAAQTMFGASFRAFYQSGSTD